MLYCRRVFTEPEARFFTAVASFTGPEARFFMIQLIGALCPSSSLMNIKAGDIGLAALIKSPGEQKKTICGTPNYIVPEVLFDTANGHSLEVDTWSISVSFYTFVVGQLPFQTKDIKEVYQ